MAVEDELRLDFQGEDSSLSSTAAKVVDQINSLDNSINKLINSFNAFSDVSSSAERGLSSFVQSTGNLEDIGNKVQEMTDDFNAMNPAVENVSNNLNNFSSTSPIIADVTNKIEEQEKKIQQNNSALEGANKKMTALKATVTALATTFKEAATAIGTVYGVLKKWTLEAADATRAQMRFGAVFDKNNGELAEAKRWVDAYSNALLLDNVEVENAISKFRILTNSMGMNNEKSKEMSFNMTQLAYDMSAVSGNDVSQTVNQLTSALNGQTKALAEYGIAIDSNTMQQYLNAHGIDRKVSSLTAAQRAEVRYMQIMESSSGMQGYYAKTLMSPANAANIVKTQFRLLTREIGNVFIPILMALVPIVIAVTKALRLLARSLARLFGINVDFDNYSEGFDLMSGGIDGIGDSADSTSEKVKNMLRDFDDLHVVDFGDDTSGGAGGGAGGGADIGGGDSLFDPVKYNGAWEDLIDKLKEAEWWVEAIAAGIAGFAIGMIIGKFLEFIGLLEKGQALVFALSAALTAIGLTITFDATKDILTNGLTPQNVLQTIGGAIVAGAGAGWMFKIMGASGVLSAKIGLIITLGLISFNLGVGIGQWINEKLGDKYDYYIKEFNLNVDEDSFGEQAKKVALILANSLNDALLEQFNVSLPQVFGTLGLMLSVGLIGALVIGFLGVPAAIAGLFGIAIAALVLGFVLVIKKIAENWEKIKAWAAEKRENIIKWFSDRVEDLKVFVKDVIQKIIDLKTKITDKLTEIKTNVTNKFTEMKTNISNKITEIKTNVTSKFDSIKNTIKTKIESARDIVKDAIDKIKGFFNFQWKFPDITIPHFGIDWDASGVVGQAFQKLGFPGLPKLKVDWYAEGGFPDKGQLFIANEREPELIGSMGNRSVVANNRQITEGIAEATYGAFRQAFSEMGDSFGGDTLVYVGDTQITDIITKKKRIQDKRFGR